MVSKSSKEALIAGHLLPLVFLSTPKACRHGVVGALQRYAAVLLGDRMRAPAISLSTPFCFPKQVCPEALHQEWLIGVMKSSGQDTEMGGIIGQNLWAQNWALGRASFGDSWEYCARLAIHFPYFFIAS